MPWYFKSNRSLRCYWNIVLEKIKSFFQKLQCVERISSNKIYIKLLLSVLQGLNAIYDEEYVSSFFIIWTHSWNWEAVLATIFYLSQLPSYLEFSTFAAWNKFWGSKPNETNLLMIGLYLSMKLFFDLFRLHIYLDFWL